MDIPKHATVNDFKRRVRSELWRQNVARELEERLEQYDMERLPLSFSKWCPYYDNYIKGTCLVETLITQRWRKEKVDGVDSILVFMG